MLPSCLMRVIPRRRLTALWPRRSQQIKAMKCLPSEGESSDNVLSLSFFFCSVLLIGFEVCNEALQMHGGYGYLKVRFHRVFLWYGADIVQLSFSLCISPGLPDRALRSRLSCASNPGGHEWNHASHRRSCHRELNGWWNSCSTSLVRWLRLMCFFRMHRPVIWPDPYFDLDNYIEWILRVAVVSNRQSHAL